MDRLITKDEVLKIAFANTDQVTPAKLKDSQIDAAQEKYLQPVFGKLMDSMLAGEHEGFVTDYVKPALAFYVRYGALPDMTIQMGNNGAQAAYTGHTNAATDKQREMLRKQALDDAEVLLSKALRYIKDHRDEFPEFEPRKNVKAHVSIKGGIVLPKHR